MEVFWAARIIGMATRAQLEAARRQMADAPRASAPLDAGARDASTPLAVSRAVTSVAHQRSQTECGPYSLYYIRRRLEGAPVETFTDPKVRISDEAMEEFRRYLFRAP